MTETVPAHDHRPLWTATGLRATCREHFWHIIDRTSVSVGPR